MGRIDIRLNQNQQNMSKKYCTVCDVTVMYVPKKWKFLIIFRFSVGR